MILCWRNGDGEKDIEQANWPFPGSLPKCSSSPWDADQSWKMRTHSSSLCMWPSLLPCRGSWSREPELGARSQEPCTLLLECRHFLPLGQAPTRNLIFWNLYFLPDWNSASLTHRPTPSFVGNGSPQELGIKSKFFFTSEL